MKKVLKLSRETLRALDLQAVRGADNTDNGCWVSRGFSNCTYCNSHTLWTDCVDATQL